MILAGKLVRTIEKNSDIIADRWVQEVTSSRYTRSYWREDSEDLHNRAEGVCRRIGYFLDRRFPKEKLASFYRRMGKARKEQGYPVEEVIMALFLLKRQIWLFILQEGMLSSHLELYQALELNNRVVLYFDRAAYYVTLAYSEEEEKEREAIKP